MLLGLNLAATVTDRAQAQQFAPQFPRHLVGFATVGSQNFFRLWSDGIDEFRLGVVLGEDYVWHPIYPHWREVLEEFPP